MAAESSPKIAIVDESPIRAAILEEGLREAGFTDVVRIDEMQSLLSRIYAIDPDVILIDLENPSRDILEQMFQVSRAVRRPIAMFVDQSDAASIQASVDAGVSAYIVDESPIRAAILQEGLREAGFTEVVHISEMQSLLARIYALDPDVILIDLENPSRDVLEQMFQVSRAVRRPIAMFVDQSDAASIQASVDAGVSAYIVDGLKKERLKPILDLCISRFNAFAKLQDELDRAKSALEDRKVIERAKGILMKLKGLNEDEAYVLLRSTAMREKKKIGEIAQSILTASELLK